MKNSRKISLIDILSNDSFQSTLEGLHWMHSENETKAWEVIKIKQVEEQSFFLAVMLRSMTRNFKFGDYIYSKRGFDLLERTSPKITKKRKISPLFHVERILHRKPKPQLTGVVKVVD